MNRKLFAGWTNVFSFTFVQTAKGKFKKTTLIMTAIAFAIAMLISIIMALVQKQSVNSCLPIEKVFVINDSNLTGLDYSIIEEIGEKYPEVSFVECEEEVENLVATGTLGTLGTDPTPDSGTLGTDPAPDSDAKENAMGPADVIVQILKSEEGYEVKLVTPPDSEISRSQGEEFLDDFSGVINNAKIKASGIEEEKLEIVMSYVSVNKMLAGDSEKSVGQEVMESILPMILSIILYLVILIYGINMGNAVSVEKTSKLMEMMLTFTRPYALIFGKITALVSSAVVQMLSIVFGFATGFFLGDFVADNFVYSGYDNYVIEVIRIIQATNSMGAFSVVSIVLFMLTLIASILFYCMLAATTGSFANKTEDVANYMSYFQLLAVAGYLISLFLPMKGIGWVNSILRIIPFTSAFVLPSDILLGKITQLSGLLYFMLLLGFSVVVSLVAGKIYMNQIFFRGKKQ